MKKYAEEIDNSISVDLGAGNPLNWKKVAKISEQIQPKHINQVFPSVGFTRAKVENDSLINALVSPTGTEGMVKISNRSLSLQAMIKEMGGNSIKFFPMKRFSLFKRIK